MKNLASKLTKLDIELPNWIRDLLYEHIIEISKDLEQQSRLEYSYKN